MIANTFIKRPVTAIVMLPGRLLIVTDGAFDVAVAKVPFWIGVVWSRCRMGSRRIPGS